METKVAGGGAAPKRVGRWTLSQLRQTDGIIPSQAGWNKGDSQKLMTNFGTPRNTTTKVMGGGGQGEGKGEVEKSKLVGNVM